MHAFHLLRTINNRSKADTAVTDTLIELGICSAGHDVGTDRKTRKGLCDHRLNLTEGRAVYINRCGIIIGMQDFHRKTIF